jgi:hypothetical protein
MHPTIEALASPDDAVVLAAIAAIRGDADWLYREHSDSVAMRDEERPMVRDAAELAAAAFPGLARRAVHGERELRLAALRALAAITGPGFPYPSPPADLGETLASLLATEDPVECVAALQAIAEVAGPHAGAVAALLERDDYYVVSMAALVLRSLRAVEAVPQLERALTRSPALVTAALLDLAPGRPVSFQALRAGYDLQIPPYSTYYDRPEIDEGYSLDTFLAYHEALDSYGSALAHVLQKLPDSACPDVLEAFGDCLDERGQPVVRYVGRLR